MDLGYPGRLFILAFDHRGSFKKKMFGITNETAEDTLLLRDAKMLVWDGFARAHAAGLPDGAGILVDEEMGTEVARKATAMKIPFAMPVERSGQDVFDFEYGEKFGDHIAEFEPTFAKVLVRWNPDDALHVKQEQGERLARLGDWLHATGRRFLFELLVPASERQMEQVDGDAHEYDLRLRPGLMLEVITELRAAGVEPDIWKIEGIDSAEACRDIADLTRAGGRDAVKCVVLGRGADDARVDHWLRTGSPIPGFAGFAIGRSIWWDAVEQWRDRAINRDAAADKIAAAYRRFIEVYEGAAA
jgi:myo-inositol catabolism protein IolC